MAWSRIWSRSSFSLSLSLALDFVYHSFLQKRYWNTSRRLVLEVGKSRMLAQDSANSEQAPSQNKSSLCYWCHVPFTVTGLRRVITLCSGRKKAAQWSGRYAHEDSKTSSLLCSLAESSFFSSSALKPGSAEVVCEATPCGILSEQLRLAGLGASSHHEAVLKIAIRFLRSLTEGVSRAPPGGISGNGDIWSTRVSMVPLRIFCIRHGLIDSLVRTSKQKRRGHKRSRALRIWCK